MGLITILGEDNFTSQFYVKRGGDSGKSSLIDLNQDKWQLKANVWMDLGHSSDNTVEGMSILLRL